MLAESERSVSTAEVRAAIDALDTTQDAARESSGLARESSVSFSSLDGSTRALLLSDATCQSIVASHASSRARLAECLAARIEGGLVLVSE